MKLDDVKTVEGLRDFLSGSQAMAFAVASNKEERYAFILSVLKRFHYKRLLRQDKGIVLQFLVKVSGYSRQQMTRMVKQYVEQGTLRRRQKTSHGFSTHYTHNDIVLLAKLDERHDTPNGAMIKKLCERAHGEFKEEGYERLSAISVSHIYNLRKSSGYQKHRRHFEKTRSPKGVAIGERRKPRTEGRPGYLRIDTVHQGDLDGRKGVYHINVVDEVTQFEFVATVEKISEFYLMPVLEQLMEEFPFVILNFHSDNGSEYVNAAVAKMLEKLRIEFTKSRARKSNDNALAEGKNAAIVRKVFGYSHIAQHHADRINQFNRDILNPYINYHRPCFFPTVIIDAKGKEKKQYKYEEMKTPYEKLKSLEGACAYLKEGVTFEKLDDIATSMSDNEAADRLQHHRKLLFNHIHEDGKKRA